MLLGYGLYAVGCCVVIFLLESQIGMIWIELPVDIDDPFWCHLSRGLLLLQAQEQYLARCCLCYFLVPLLLYDASDGSCWNKPCVALVLLILT